MPNYSDEIATKDFSSTKIKKIFQNFHWKYNSKLHKLIFHVLNFNIIIIQVIFKLSFLTGWAPFHNQSIFRQLISHKENSVTRFPPSLPLSHPFFAPPYLKLFHWQLSEADSIVPLINTWWAEGVKNLNPMYTGSPHFLSKYLVLTFKRKKKTSKQNVTSAQPNFEKNRAKPPEAVCNDKEMTFSSTLFNQTSFLNTSISGAPEPPFHERGVGRRDRSNPFVFYYLAVTLMAPFGAAGLVFTVMPPPLSVLSRETQSRLGEEMTFGFWR